MKDLMSVIGYEFHDIDLLNMALTHSSYTNEQKQNPLTCYERLEFLGDAVLQIVSSDYLYRNFPDLPEGRLSKARASLVCEQALNICAQQLGLGEYLRLGKGEASCGGRNRVSILADVVEAIIGAIYLDSDLDEAKAFIYRTVLKNPEERMVMKDFKTTLQELAQKNVATLRYELTGMTGPDHDRTFEIAVYYNEEFLGSGIGKSKKAAEQEAASKALKELMNR